MAYLEIGYSDSRDAVRRTVEAANIHVKPGEGVVEVALVDGGVEEFPLDRPFAVQPKDDGGLGLGGGL